MSNRALPGAILTAERELAKETPHAKKLDPEQPQRRTFRFISRLSPLWICLLIALALRVWLTVRTHAVIDGDEAMVGIQAENILRGELPLPLYFYGQPYMGSLEAYLVAILFKIAIPSAWTLRAEPILLSLVVVWLTGKMATALANTAHLSLRAMRLFSTTAMLFAAVSPVYDTVLELHTLGGYIETFILMLALLLSAFRLTQRWQEGASNNELARRWASIGFIIGLGLWVDPLIASAIITAALWIAGSYVATRMQRKGNTGERRLPGTTSSPPMNERRRQYTSRFFIAMGSIAGFVCGASPAIVWGMGYKWANVTYLLQLGSQPQSLAFQQQYPTHLDVIRGMISFYSAVMTPRLVGGALSGEDAISSALHTLTTITGAICIFITLALVICSYIFRLPLLRCIRHLADLPLLFAFSTAVLFCTSPIASTALTSSQHDFAGRYATPLMLALPFFFATPITAVSLWLYEKPLLSSIYRTFSFLECHWAKAIVEKVLFALLLLTLALQGASYGMVDPAATFQSPSCPIAPANDDPIIAYLQQEHVHYAWAIPWIGNPITFKTNESIITADPRPIINFKGVTRINAYLRDVSLATRPAMLTFVMHNDPYPLLLWILDTRHITYRAAFFPSEPGIDVLVVTQLSRRFSLYESKYLGDVFTNCI